MEPKKYQILEPQMRSYYGIENKQTIFDIFKSQTSPNLQPLYETELYHLLMYYDFLEKFMKWHIFEFLQTFSKAEFLLY